jgi:hypothetical protein
MSRVSPTPSAFVPYKGRPILEVDRHTRKLAVRKGHGQLVVRAVAAQFPALGLCDKDDWAARSDHAVLTYNNTCE